MPGRDLNTEFNIPTTWDASSPLRREFTAILHSLPSALSGLKAQVWKTAHQYALVLFCYQFTAVPFLRSSVSLLLWCASLVVAASSLMECIVYIVIVSGPLDVLLVGGLAVGASAPGSGVS